MTRTACIGAIALTLSVSAADAQTKPVTKTEMVTATATIQAIDTTTRTLTLRDEKGVEEAIVVPAEVKRFPEFKVGQKVQARYYESIALQLRKPGDKTPMAAPTDTTKLTPNAATSQPGATLARQLTATVTVEAIDLKLPSITVRTSDGRQVVRKVDNVKHLDGVKVGDRIDITYTQAVAVSVEPVK